MKTSSGSIHAVVHQILSKSNIIFTGIWQFNDFQNGGRPPSWILKTCSLYHVAFVGMSFCFLIQNFAEIGQSVNDLWPKKQFSRWSRDCNQVQYLRYTKFYDSQNSGRPPCWILKICIFCPVALVDLPFCFLMQNFAEIGQSVDDLWPKKSDFQDSDRRHLEFKKFQFWSRDCNRVQYLM